MQYTEILLVFGVGIVGLLAGLFILPQKKISEAEKLNKAQKFLSKAENETQQILGRARLQAADIKKQAEIEQNEFAAQLDRMEKMFVVKSGSQHKREEKITQLKKNLQQEESTVSTLRLQTNELGKQMQLKLGQITGLNKEAVKEKLLSDYEVVMRQDAEIRLQRETEWIYERAARDGRAVLSDAIYRFSHPTSVEHEHAQVIAPRDEIKGRIVGRGGRNIAFFEQLFNVDVIFNDEPNTIIISCFNLVHRETAKLAIERLMREKFISEDIILKIKPLAEQDMAKILCKEGEYVLAALGLKNFSPDFAKLLGRLRFRTSYGQNALKHCFEVGCLAKLMASEIGADENIAWMAGVFHDIGKAVDQEVEGSHDVLTKEILEKYGFSNEIVHAAWTHHNAAPPETAEAKIVQAADAISAGRPGARAESLERYLAKIKDLQETALSFEGVKKAYAINAGREVRVFVDETKIDDSSAVNLASGIAAKVEEKGGYPGKIKVTTIRVTKASDYAKSKIK